MNITRRSFLKGVLVSAVGAAAPASALYMVPALPAPRVAVASAEAPIIPVTQSED